MSMRMLIDAAHPEETRVVVTRENRLEAFEFESGSKKQLKGNIYLAKVTRVEPSLQAAFIDYGGNRHGFLSFNEIHPDYYQIPIEDREELLDQQDDADDNDDRSENGGSAEDEGIESLGGEDEIDEDIKRRSRALRRYKIHEVIKRRQILLVQVVKEERGNKGAALTTYLSLAGRYCVLMPNTARGGGISRKIANPADRKRLKTIATGLEVPKGMGVIIRTAGLNRTKPEIKRDYEYLLRTWNQVRDLTLDSIAPQLVHEEGDLIKRAIRDLYKKDIDEILVSGDFAYRSAKDFMKTLMPSQAKVVQPYRESVPLFHKYQVEREIDEMYSPRATLKSGAYLIINPTEALVAVDVNSGRATKQRNIEETAYRTNLEAAEEIARQIRLRDLAGLIVIDFIDMEVSKNVRAVEAKMKECLKADRARIQVGRISSFGLMEMSRQRLRPDLMEASANACPACGGAGVVRSTESTALAVLRSIDDEGLRESSAKISVDAPPDVAIYVLNQKRAALQELEQRYNFQIEIKVDDSLLAPNFKIENQSSSDGQGKTDVAKAKPTDTPETADTDGNEDERGSGRKRRRKRRRRPRREDETANTASSQTDETDDRDGEKEPDSKQPQTGESEATVDAKDDAEKPQRRRRSRRGGRGRSRGGSRADADTNASDPSVNTADATSESKSNVIAETDTATQSQDPALEDANTESGMATSQAEPTSVGTEAGQTEETSLGEDASTDIESQAVPKKKEKAPRKRAPRQRRLKSVDEKPKTTRRRTKISADSSDDSGDEAANKSTRQPSGDTDPSSSVPDMSSPPISEPTSDPVMPLAATESAESENSGSAAQNKPKRRGWWQRKLS